MDPETKQIETYEYLVKFAKRYRKGTQEPLEMANMAFVEFVEGNYQAIVDTLTPDITERFFRAFVKRRCLREMTRGNRYIPTESFPTLSSQSTPHTDIVKAFGIAKSRSLVESLSQQEQVVVDMLMDGATYRDISKAIGRSLGTVHNIINRIRVNPDVQELRKIVRGDDEPEI